jgi:hypothetical protein
MNAIEIEEAVTVLSEAPFDRSEFQFYFLKAFGNKETTIKKQSVQHSMILKINHQNFPTFHWI